MRFRREPLQIAKMYMVIRVLIVSIIAFFLSTYFNVFEQLHMYVESHEDKNFDELFVVAVVFAVWLLGELVVLNRKLKCQSMLNQEFAVKDMLTGLNNRRGFFDQTGSNLKRCLKKDKNTLVIYIDINKFKKINDTYGHDTGDNVLIRVAEELRSITSENDIVARIGGDEFIVLSNSDSNRTKEDYTEKLKQIIVFDDDSLEKPIDIKLSYGVAVHPKDGGTIDELLCVADMHMYEMKKVNSE